MKSRRLTCLAILLCVASALAALRAQSPDEQEVAALDGERPALLVLPLSDAPGATTVITAVEISRSGAANIFELLRRVPGVDIRYTPMGGHIGIRTNGASPFSEQVLLLIDGSPYNSPDKGGFPGHPNYVGFFPLDRIARVEIVKGPVSVLYGANAFGGVINIVSKQAVDVVQDRIEGNAYGMTLRGGQRDLLEAGGRLSTVRGKWNGAIDAGIDESDTPIVQNGNASHTRSHVYASGRRGNLWGSILHQESRHGSFSFEGVPTQVAKNRVDILDMHYDRRVGKTVLRTSATLNRYHGTTCAECHNSQSGPPDDAVTNDVGSERETDDRVRLALRADRTLGDRQDLTFGLEVAHDSVQRRIVKLADAPQSLNSAGAYVQHQWHLAHRSVHLLTGFRFDYAERLDEAFSPRVALVLEPTDDLVVRGSWSRAYRAPTWNERFRRQRFLPFEIAPNTILVFQGNPDLTRERNDSAEVGVSFRARPDLVLKLDLFENQISNFVELGDSTFVVGSPNEVLLEYENRNRTYTARGGELTLLARPARSVSVTFGYAYRTVDLSEEDPAATYAPRDRLVLTTAWTPTPRWSFDLAGSYEGEFTALDAGAVIREPSSTLLDTAVHYQWPVRRTVVRAGVLCRNCTDRHAVQSGSEGTMLRGRSVVVELTWDF